MPRRVDSPTVDAGKARPRMLNHHKLGRHSVASQAVTSGESVKAVKAQLGHKSEQSTHKYAHLGSGAQRRLVEALAPTRAPHQKATSEAHGNLTATSDSSVREAAE